MVQIMFSEFARATAAASLVFMPASVLCFTCLRIPTHQQFHTLSSTSRSSSSIFDNNFRVSVADNTKNAILVCRARAETRFFLFFLQ